jgi:hypothetical protein
VYIKIGYAERRKPEPEESEHDRWS